MVFAKWKEREGYSRQRGSMCKKAHGDGKSDEKETIVLLSDKLGSQLKKRKPV